MRNYDHCNGFRQADVTRLSTEENLAKKTRFHGFALQRVRRRRQRSRELRARRDSRVRGESDRYGRTTNNRRWKIHRASGQAGIRRVSPPRTHVSGAFPLYQRHGGEVSRKTLRRGARDRGLSTKRRAVLLYLMRVHLPELPVSTPLQPGLLKSWFQAVLCSVPWPLFLLRGNAGNPIAACTIQKSSSLVAEGWGGGF